MKSKIDELLEMQLNDYDIGRAKSKAETLESSLSAKEEELSRKIRELERIRHELKARENSLGAQNRKIRTHQLIVLGAELDRVIEKDFDVTPNSKDLKALREYLTRYRDSINRALTSYIEEEPVVSIDNPEGLFNASED